MHYNFCRVHKTLRVTPAMEAGLAHDVWTVEDLVTITPGPVAKKRGSYKPRKNQCDSMAGMKQCLYIVFGVSAVVLLVFALASKLPSYISDYLLLPGFVVANTLNGSLHDHVMRGYFVIGLISNCAFYSGIALLGLRSFRKRQI